MGVIFYLKMTGFKVPMSDRDTFIGIEELLIWIVHEFLPQRHQVTKNNHLVTIQLLVVRC